MESTADTQKQAQSVHESDTTSQQSGTSHKRTVGKRLKEGTGHTVQGEEKIGGDLKFQKNPPFLAERKQIFDELFDAQQKKYQGKIEYTIYQWHACHPTPLISRKIFILILNYCFVEMPR